MREEARSCEGDELSGRERRRRAKRLPKHVSARKYIIRLDGGVIFRYTVRHQARQHAGQGKGSQAVTTETVPVPVISKQGRSRLRLRSIPRIYAHIPTLPLVAQYNTSSVCMLDSNIEPTN